MASPGDRRAVGVLVIITVTGALVRVSGVASDGPTGGVAYRVDEGQQRPDRDSVRARMAAVGRPLASGERINVNTADVTDLDRLPRIGPALAGRIVRDREARGGFQSLEDLQRVPGIGGGLAEALSAHVTFGGAAPGRSPRFRRARPAPIRLNTATAKELATLPGIGPARAEAIVAFRSRHGPFKTAADLSRVRGIGPGIVARVRALVYVP